jgi:hypothetical protein
VLLPHEDHVLVRLQMDVLGVIDWDRDEISIDAVLYDSAVLTQALTGEMALRSRWSGDPTFLLAVGGFNPNFTATLRVPELARVALTVNRGDSTRLRLESYFALTSNTVQAGANVDLLVRASGFSVEGLSGLRRAVPVLAVHVHRGHPGRDHAQVARPDAHGGGAGADPVRSVAVARPRPGDFQDLAVFQVHQLRPGVRRR